MPSIFTVVVGTDNFSIDFYAAIVAERRNPNENKTHKNQTADSTAHAVHGAVAGTDIGICGGFRQSAMKRN